MKYIKSEYDAVPLEECSREEDEDGVSQHDMMLAFIQMPEEFTDEELNEQVTQVVAQRILNSLCDKGLVEAAWDPKQEDVVYYAKKRQD